MLFLCFYGDTYYPSGGFTDTYKDFSNKDEAIGFAKGVIEGESCKWSHVCVIGLTSSGRWSFDIIWDSQNKNACESRRASTGI